MSLDAMPADDIGDDRPRSYEEAKARYEASKAGSTCLVELRALRDEMTALYFRRRPEKGFIGEETVTRVYVIDPVTGENDTAVYLGSDGIFELNVGKAHFKGDASHLAQWLDEMGYLMQWHEVKVAV